MLRSMLMVAAVLGSISSAFAGPSEVEAAKRILAPDDDRLYCHAGGRWSENAVRCLTNQQNQRCVPAEVTGFGSNMAIAPARWADVKIGGTAPVFCSN